MLTYILVTLAFGMAGGLIYFYYLKKGQFEDPEEPKYQMLRKEEPPLDTKKESSLSYGDEPIN